MTSAHSPDPSASRPKVAMPPLDTRAPRPRVVRLRRGAVAALAMAGSGLVGGALAWAFVVQPQLQAHARPTRPDPGAGAGGDVRPSEQVVHGPATYANLDQLPPPRTFGSAAATPSARAGPGAKAPAKPTPSGPNLGSDARRSSLFFAAAQPPNGPTGQGSAAPAPRGDYAAVYNPHDLEAPLSPNEIKAGSILPGVLLTAVDTSRAGPVVATVAQDIFDSVTGRRLLIPQGSRLIGAHEGESRYGDRRAVILWARLILPNGKSLVLSKEPGVDAEGTVGFAGEVDRRLLPLAMATLFSGAITAVGEAARERSDHSTGLLGDAGDAASIEAAQVGGKLIDRELTVHPVIRLRQGARVNVLITRDLILEPYVR
jgi:type IV secretion system protein VirB10